MGNPIFTPDEVPTLPIDGAQFIGRCAVRALYHELICYPKPGLVSLVDPGSHTDMDAAVFMRSLHSLRPYFPAIVTAGSQSAPFAVLQNLGRAAETRMLQATGGVNTHRGAIFSLGLLAAAAGSLHNAVKPGGARVAMALGDVVRRHWGADIMANQYGDSHGLQAARHYRAGGARTEAAQGFPMVFTVGLPAWQEARTRGCDVLRASVQTVFRLIAVLEDTNLLYRGGTRGLAFAQGLARDFLAGGGVHRQDWYPHAVAIHRAFMKRNLSPGGSADLFSATLFVAYLLNGADIACRSSKKSPEISSLRAD